MVTETSSTSSGGTAKSFHALFVILRDRDLFKDGPPQEVNLRDPASVKAAIAEARGELPGLYQDTYVAPLLRNIEPTIHRCSPATVETLAGAVYGHRHPDKKVRDGLKGMLAVMSNIYRSFIVPEFGVAKALPEPIVRTPSLVTFRPKLYLKNNPPEFGPFIMPATEVQRLCGGQIGVVTIPSNYRDQPALYWGALAHEVGGHDVLHSYDGLVWEMQHKVRRLFYKGGDPSGERPTSRNQFSGLLWQFWTEEAASDVCAIMNLGPAYAMGVSVYLAALNERIARWKQEEQNGRATPGEKPTLTTSWPPPNSTIPDVNSHPTDILKLNVMVGAIEGLRALDSKYKTTYSAKIRQLINTALANSTQPTDTIQIKGWIQFKPGRWILADDKQLDMKRAEMEEQARLVGRLIATEQFEALNGNRLQDLETWSDSDQSLAENNSKLMLSRKTADSVGDDAQLVAGAILALFANPDESLYQSINLDLISALGDSFESDPTWATETWHPIY